MRAAIFNGPRNIVVGDRPDPGIVDSTDAIVLARRSFLRFALLGATSLVVGCQTNTLATLSPAPATNRPSGGSTIPSTSVSSPSSDAPADRDATTRRVLIAYFSRAGENYFNGGRTVLEVGNTEVLAGMIEDRLACDVFRIEAVDPYPEGYDETVARNVAEQEADSRPAIVNALESIDAYDTILLGSPIWNVRTPMIMSTFTERFDFTGKTVYPFVTFAVSGLGSTERDYGKTCRGATIGEGLAVRGEEVNDGGPAAEAWLQQVGLL